MNQRGFATLEVILMVMVIGILASIAVPRFTAVTTAANTAKIQADLTTIDTAIAIYVMREGKNPSKLSDLTDYLRGADGDLKPPAGKCYVEGEEKNVPATEYKVDTSNDEIRALCGSYTAEKFYAQKKS